MHPKNTSFQCINIPIQFHVIAIHVAVLPLELWSIKPIN